MNQIVKLILVAEEETGTERLSNLTKVTELASGKNGTPIHVCIIHAQCNVTERAKRV